MVEVYVSCPGHLTCKMLRKKKRFYVTFPSNWKFWNVLEEEAEFWESGPRTFPTNLIPGMGRIDRIKTAHHHTHDTPIVSSLCWMNAYSFLCLLKPREKPFNFTALNHAHPKVFWTVQILKKLFAGRVFFKSKLLIAETDGLDCAKPWITYSRRFSLKPNPFFPKGYINTNTFHENQREVEKGSSTITILFCLIIWLRGILQPP